MNHTEENREKRAGNFRVAMDIGMGLFYTTIGTILIYARSFGKMTDIPPFIAWILGGMMVIGGVFRFYRGLKEVLPQKKDNDTTPFE